MPSQFDDDFNKFSRGSRKVGWFSAKWIIAIAVVLMAIGIGTWAFKVATSDVKGRGDAVVLKNSALNRTQAQAQFEQRIANIRLFDTQLSDTQVELDKFNQAHPNVGNGSSFDPLAEQLGNLTRTYTGIQQQCRRVVEEYNSEARTYTLQDFRSEDLPHQIVKTDPYFVDGLGDFDNFNCQPNKA